MSTLCPEDLVTPPRSPLTPSPGFSLLTPSVESGGTGLGPFPSLLHHSSPRIPIPGAAGVSGSVDVSTAAESDVCTTAVNGESHRCCRAATATLSEECEVEEEGGSDEAATAVGEHVQPLHEASAGHHLGVVHLPPSFGLTPPEEEGLKTTDGILKVR